MELWCEGYLPQQIQRMTGFSETAIRMVIKRSMPVGGRIA